MICYPLTAIYEVYQNGVLYCDPYSVDDIKTKILEFETPEIYSQYVAQSQVRSKEMFKLQEEHLNKLVDFILS